MNKIDKLIATIPTDQMQTGFQQQRTNLEQQLALNAAAYRLQQANTALSDADRKQVLRQIADGLLMIQAQIDDIDRRLNGAANALNAKGKTT